MKRLLFLTALLLSSISFLYGSASQSNHPLETYFHIGDILPGSAQSNLLWLSVSNLKSALAMNPGNDYAVLKVMIPGPVMDNPALCYESASQIFQVYRDSIDKKNLMFDDNFQRVPLKRRATGMGNDWNIISIEKSDSGKWIYFRVYTSFRPDFINYHDIYFGRSDVLVINIIKRSLDNFSLSLIIMFFSFMMLILFLTKRSERDAYLGLSIFMFFLSFHNISECGIQLMLYKNPLFWAYSAWISSLILFIGLFIYMNDIFIRKNKLFFNILIIAQSTYALTVLTLDALNIVAISDTEQFYFVYILVLILVCFIVIMKEVLMGSIEALIVIIGTVSVGITETYDVLGRAFNILPWKRNLVIYGIFVFVLSQSLVLLLRFLKVYRERESLTLKLSERNKSLEEVVSSRTSELTGALNNLRQRNLKMEEDLTMARKIQMSILPDKSPLREIAMFYKPIERVGGDFYDFVSFKGRKKIGIFISDVSGHGVPAAFITSLIKGTLQRSDLDESDPASFLFMLNDFLYLQTNDNFITAFCTDDPEERSLVYSNAGHNLPFIIKDGKLEQLISSNRGVPLAIMKSNDISTSGKTYTNLSISLEKNSKILLYTDGLLEAVNISESLKGENAADFEEKELGRVISELVNANSVEFVYRLYQKLVEFRGSNSFDDDICMICIDVK